MSQPIVKSLIDEQVEEIRSAQVRGTFALPAGMRVADLPCRIKADWLKRRPVERRA
jgi:hypothetical protein